MPEAGAPLRSLAGEIYVDGPASKADDSYRAAKRAVSLNETRCAGKRGAGKGEGKFKGKEGQGKRRAAAEAGGAGSSSSSCRGRSVPANAASRFPLPRPVVWLRSPGRTCRSHTSTSIAKRFRSTLGFVRTWPGRRGAVRDGRGGSSVWLVPSALAGPRRSTRTTRRTLGKRQAGFLG